MILLLALACRPDPPVGPPSPASWVEESGAVGAEVIGASGGESATVRVRAFNAFGGSTLGADATVEVNGQDSDVDIGAQGYGELVIDEPGTYALTLGASEATAYVYGVDWPGIGMMRGFQAPMQTQQDALSAGSGVLTIDDNELWWTGTDVPAHRVLVSDGTIGGVAVGHYDGDGVLDAAAWSGRSIHFLRGRSGGGMTYAGHLRSPTHTVAGIDFGDTTDDDIPDLAIVWIGPPSQGRLDIWESDGLLGFTPGPNRVLTNLPFDVAAGDNTGEGRPQVTVTIDGGNWERYFQAPIGYAPSGPAIELDLVQFTRVYSPGDVNRDGSDELIFVPPFIPGTQRRVVLFDLDGDVPTFTGITREDSHVVIDDLDQDGLYDLLFSESEGDLVAIHAEDEGEGLQTDTLMRGLPPGAPVARVPGTQRLLLAGEEDWLWIDGSSTPDEWFLTEDPPLISAGLTVRDGVYELRELDGDPSAPELLGLRGGPNSTELRVWTMRTTGVEVLGSVVLDPAEKELKDLAVCDRDAYVLLEDQLIRLDLTDESNPVIDGSLAVTARRVACGNGPAGPVSVLTDTSALLLDDSLVQVGVTPASGAEDLHLDSLGTVTCDRVGCRVTRAAVGPDGEVVKIVGWPDGAEIDGEPVYARGLPTVVDIDGNGHLDVLFHDAGRIVLHRHTGDTLGPPEIFHTRRLLAGQLAIADYDGDGFLDAWGVEPENLRVRVTSSVTNPFQPPPQPDTASDTGDTGAIPDTAPPVPPTDTNDTASP